MGKTNTLDELPFDPADALTEAEAARLRRLMCGICGEGYVEMIERRAEANALRAGFTPQGYAEKLAPAPIAIALLFALDPEFMS